MNNTALTIRTDAKTKKAIADFAASLGLSTSAFVTAVTLQAVRERRLTLTPPDLEPLEPTPYLEDIMRTADADIKAGRNLSPVFDNADDFLADLEKADDDADTKA